jgi:hypothetical protein
MLQAVGVLADEIAVRHPIESTGTEMGQIADDSDSSQLTKSVDSSEVKQEVQKYSQDSISNSLFTQNTCLPSNAGTINKTLFTQQQELWTNSTPDYDSRGEGSIYETD